eukprot:CFRG0632T1
MLSLGMAVPTENNPQTYVPQRDNPLKQQQQPHEKASDVNNTYNMQVQRQPSTQYEMYSSQQSQQQVPTQAQLQTTHNYIPTPSTSTSSGPVVKNAHIEWSASAPAQAQAQAGRASQYAQGSGGRDDVNSGMVQPQSGTTTSMGQVGSNAYTNTNDLARRDSHAEDQSNWQQQNWPKGYAKPPKGHRTSNPEYNKYGGYQQGGSAQGGQLPATASTGSIGANVSGMGSVGVSGSGMGVGVVAQPDHRFATSDGADNNGYGYSGNAYNSRPSYNGYPSQQQNYYQGAQQPPGQAQTQSGHFDGSARGMGQPMSQSQHQYATQANPAGFNMHSQRESQMYPVPVGGLGPYDRPPSRGFDDRSMSGDSRDNKVQPYASQLYGVANLASGRARSEPRMFQPQMSSMENDRPDRSPFSVSPPGGMNRYNFAASDNGMSMNDPQHQSHLQQRFAPSHLSQGQGMVSRMMGDNMDKKDTGIMSMQAKGQRDDGDTDYAGGPGNIPEPTRRYLRRATGELTRLYVCPERYCELRYEAWRSLQHHLAVKHKLRRKKSDYPQFKNFPTCGTLKP